MAATTLDGEAVFGYAVNVIHVPAPNAQQMNHFFGINGQQTLFGGTRGRTFSVAGVLIANSLEELNDLESLIMSFADGLTHTLIDSRGRQWDNVVFPGEYHPSPLGIKYLAGGGYCLPYTLTLVGMT